MMITPFIMVDYGCIGMVNRPQNKFGFPQGIAKPIPENCKIFSTCTVDDSFDVLYIICKCNYKCGILLALGFLKHWSSVEL